MVLVEPRNGTVPLRITTVDIELEEIGYAGWVVTMRTNPRASVYDDLMNIDDMERWWHAFGQVVQSWNLADEDGQPLPLPRDIDSERDLDLPVGVVGFMFRRYIEEFRGRIGLPKVPDANSETTSRTSADPRTNEAAQDPHASTSP